MRGDLDLRIATIHVFCEGFIEQPILPGSDLWKNIIRLRNFRNSVFHDNQTDEDKIYMLREDYFTFPYSPRVDFRGSKIAKQKDSQFAVTMSEIDEDVNSEIVEIVNAVVQSLLLAMDEETRAWVRSWLWKTLILPRYLVVED